MKNDKEIRDLFSSLAENEHPDRAVACAQVGACLVRFSQSVRVAFDHHLSSWSESTVIAVKQHYADTFSQHEGETYLLAGWLYFNYQFQTWPTQPNAKALNWVYHMSRRVAKILSESLARVGGPVNYARLHAVLCEQFNMTVEFVPPIVVPNKLALHLSLLQPFIQEIYVCFHNVDSNPQMNGFPRWFSGWQNFELRYLKNKKEPVYVYAKEVTVQPNKTMINKKQSLESLITQNKWSLLYTIVLERTGDENQRVLIQAREELSNQTISPSQKLIQSEKNVQTASFIPKDVWKFGIFPHLLPKDRASAGGTCHFLHAMNR